MSNASLFEYDCEAVRVRARRTNPSTNEEEHRKFSVDPNLTSYDILKSILTRAFDVSTDFVIYFMSAGEWLPLLSDWDLDVAILSAAEPCLNLMIKTNRHAILNFDDNVSEKSISSPKDEISLQITTNMSSNKKSPNDQSDAPMFQSLRQHVEKSIMPGLASRFQKALNMAEDTIVPKGQQLLSMLDSSGPANLLEEDLVELKPLADKDFKTFMNKVGEIIRPRELRLVIYQRGIEPQLRKVLWKHLLGVYPAGLTGRQRVDYMKSKVNEYEDMKQTWTNMMLHGRVTDDLKYVTNMVKKDVLRTDRHLNYFSGESNANITILYNILTTYALNHPSVGYCQGMSDLLSPILVVMADEGQAYVSFCALMIRLKPNFFSDGKAMTKRFEHLSQGLLYYDPEFYSYLKLRHADDLLFCYRWLLLEMKREFSFDDACAALEVLWASLPPNSKNNEVHGAILFEEKFGRKIISKSKSGFPLSGSAFTNVVTLRKRLSSHEESSPKRKVSHSQPRGRIQSAGAVEEPEKHRTPTRSSLMKKSNSLMSNKASGGNNTAKINSIESNTLNKIPQEVNSTPKKRVSNLNDFYKLSQNKDKHNDESEVSPDKDKIDNNDMVSSSSDYTIGESLNIQFNRLPSPAVFGDGNPFLMFMCIACILQHRDYIIEQQLDHEEIAMYFNRMVRRHNVKKTLGLARKMFAEYLNDDWKRDLSFNNQNDSLEAC